MNSKTMVLLAALVALTALAVPSTLAYGSNGYPPYGAYWGYDWGASNYISPPIYIGGSRGSSCMLGVRSAYWGGFSGCNGGYQAQSVRSWGGTSPYSGGSNYYNSYSGGSRSMYGW